MSVINWSREEISAFTQAWALKLVEATSTESVGIELKIHLDFIDELESSGRVLPQFTREMRKISQDFVDKKLSTMKQIDDLKKFAEDSEVLFCRIGEAKSLGEAKEIAYTMIEIMKSAPGLTEEFIKISEEKILLDLAKVEFSLSANKICKHKD